MNDFAVFYDLFHYDFAPLEAALGTDVFDVLTDYRAIVKPELMYNKNVSEKVRALSLRLEAAAGPEGFFDEVCEFYRAYGVGMFGLNKAFRIEEKVTGGIEFLPINNMDTVTLDDLVGYESQKKRLIENTEAFVEGRGANNVLLYGDAGTGKSATVKAIANSFAEEGLRLIELSKKELNAFRKAVHKKSKLYKELGQVLGALRSLEKEYLAEDGLAFVGSSGQDLASVIASEDIENLYFALWHLSSLMGDFFEHPERYQPEEGPLSAEVLQACLETYFSVLTLLRTYEHLDEGYLTYFEKRGTSLVLHLFCADPSSQLKAQYEKVRSVIFFSATLTPVDYYKRLLAETSDTAIALPSPFPEENRCVLLCPLPMTYRERRDAVPGIVRLIHEMVQVKRGHYLVFFPSFAFLEQVLEAYQAESEEVLVQSREMDEAARAAFLKRFQQQEGAVTGFCVMGGMFSEGIDLVGEQLLGAAVISVGVPQIGTERDLIRDHLNRMQDQACHGHGYEYAYMYPGFCKVMQAAGRVIRTEKDRGVILLIDARFREDRYRRLFPEEWRGVRQIKPEETGKILEAFWSGQG